MKHFFLKSIAGFFLLIFFFGIPLFSFAQTDPAVGTNDRWQGIGLVPCASSKTTGETMCNLCYLIVGVDNIVDYILMLLGIVGFLMLVVAGVMYIVSGGNESIISAAKKAIWSGLVGFGIVLLAWVIINTVIFYFLPLSGDSIGLKVLGWSEYTCETSR